MWPRVFVFILTFGPWGKRQECGSLISKCYTLIQGAMGSLGRKWGCLMQCSGYHMVPGMDPRAWDTARARPTKPHPHSSLSGLRYVWVPDTLMIPSDPSPPWVSQLGSVYPSSSCFHSEFTRDWKMGEWKGCTPQWLSSWCRPKWYRDRPFCWAHTCHPLRVCCPPSSVLAEGWACLWSAPCTPCWQTQTMPWVNGRFNKCLWAWLDLWCQTRVT